MTVLWQLSMKKSHRTQNLNMSERGKSHTIYTLSVFFQGPKNKKSQIRLRFTHIVMGKCLHWCAHRYSWKWDNPISSYHCSFILLSEAQGEADHRASDFGGSVHPAGLPGLPRPACTLLPENGRVVVSGVTVLCGDYSHHRWLRGLCTRYWHTRRIYSMSLRRFSVIQIILS